jgi:hypothetical protein
MSNIVIKVREGAGVAHAHFLYCAADFSLSSGGKKARVPDSGVALSSTVKP